MRVDLSNYNYEETTLEQREAFSLQDTRNVLTAWTVAAKEFASGSRRFLTFVQDSVHAGVLLERHTIGGEAPEALNVLSMGLDIAVAASKDVSSAENLLLSHKEAFNQLKSSFNYREELVEYSGSLLDMAQHHGLSVDKISKSAIRNKIISLRKERNLASP